MRGFNANSKFTIMNLRYTYRKEETREFDDNWTRSYTKIVGSETQFDKNSSAGIERAI